jgi:hypothetical protein
MPRATAGRTAKYADFCIYVPKCYTLDPFFHIVKAFYLAKPLIPLLERIYLSDILSFSHFLIFI